MIFLDKVTRTYGDFIAVDQVSVEIGAGEIIGLLGHNGAGKTTIMKMLTGYLEPTFGRIEIDGLEIGPDTRSIQSRLGYLPENCPLYPDMTVIDFLDYQAALHGVPAAARIEAIRSAIIRTELGSKATQTIQTLSRGYRQRVGVAQAIIHNPKILVLDEPTNGLDPAQIQHMRDLIRDLAENATILLSTHILQEVQAVCDRVIILESGRKAVDAKLAEIQSVGRIVITLDRAPDNAVPLLERIGEVSAVETLASTATGRYDYAVSAAPDSAPAIAEALHTASMPVFALYPERRDLETVFAEVIQGAKVREVKHVA